MKIHSFAVGLLTAAMAGQVVPGKVWGVELGGANAAATYRQAFEAAEAGGAKNADASAPLDDNARKTLDANQNTVTLVRRAAGEPSCDWGDVSDMNAVLAELNRARSVSHLMLTRARADVQDKHPDAAVDDWVATVAMARRVGEMNLLVSRLVAVAVESQAIDQALPEVPKLPDASRKKFAADWAKLPKPPTGKSMIMGEYAYARQAIAKQKVSQDWVTILEPFYKSIADAADGPQDQFEKVGSSRVDLQACKLEYSIVSPK